MIAGSKYNQQICTSKRYSRPKVQRENVFVWGRFYSCHLDYDATYLMLHLKNLRATLSRKSFHVLQNFGKKPRSTAFTARLIGSFQIDPFARNGSDITLQHVSSNQLCKGDGTYAPDFETWWRPCSIPTPFPPTSPVFTDSSSFLPRLRQKFSSGLSHNVVTVFFLIPISLTRIHFVTDKPAQHTK